MYAVINTGGKQAKVEKGTVLAVERLSADVGSTVSLPVLFVADGENVYATPSELAGTTVTAEVLEHFKGEKQIVFKFKKRKGYKRMKGHRQTLTSVRVLEIAVGGTAAKAEKPKAEKPKAEKPKAEKPKAEVAVAPVKAPKMPPAAVSEEAAQCAAVKSDGTPCTNKAKEGSKYCGVHAKKYEG
jgi:large subunit ribosomal protein L21